MYNGQDMNEDKAPFYKEGVAYGHLQVTAPGGTMEVTVDGGTRTGYAYINLHTIHNTAPLTLTLSQASGTLPRIDRIVLRNDETERKPSIYVLEGAFSSNPQAPELVNNDVIRKRAWPVSMWLPERLRLPRQTLQTKGRTRRFAALSVHSLKNWTFPSGPPSLTNGFQARKSGGKDHAAFIKEYTTMVQQFQTERTAQWDEWFATKQEQLAGDVAGKLQLQIDGLRTKVHNMAHKVNVAYLLKQSRRRSR